MFFLFPHFSIMAWWTRSKFIMDQLWPVAPGSCISALNIRCYLAIKDLHLSENTRGTVLLYVYPKICQSDILHIWVWQRCSSRKNVATFSSETSQTSICCYRGFAHDWFFEMTASLMAAWMAISPLPWHLPRGLPSSSAVKNTEELSDALK